MRNIIFCLLVVCGIFGTEAIAQTPTPDLTPHTTPTPTAQPPVVTNGNRIYLDDTSVRLYGAVNPNGLFTTVWAEYGTGSYYTNTSPTQNISGTATTQRISIDLSGLLLDWNYDDNYGCRIVAQNSAGTSYGRKRSIYSITPQFLSGVVTYDATDVTPNSAVLHGEITTVPHDIWFEFDTVEGEYFYTADANGTDTNYIAILTGLSPATTYYYRMAASDKLYAYYGETKFFTTSEATHTSSVTLYTLSATNITSNSATLNGLVCPAHTARITASFDYSTTLMSDAENECFEGATDSSTSGIDKIVSMEIKGLQPSTTYYYRMTATQTEILPPSGYTCYLYGNVRSFATLGATTTVFTSVADTEISPLTIFPTKLKLQKKQSGNVIVAILDDNGCPIEGTTVTATIGKAGSKRISITPTNQATDENGEAIFIITAKNKAGNARVTFSTGSLKNSIVVKVK